jgi:dTMP kinase
MLQRIDGVPIDFVEAINAQADTPHLAVVLTADPLVTADRITHRGAHNRFESGLDSSRVEADLCADTIARLAERRYPLMIIDTGRTPSEVVVDMIVERIAHLAGVPCAAPSRA